MDYCICKAASYNSEGLKSLLIIYDVCCQWRKRFPERLLGSPWLSLPESMALEDICYAVGKFHLSAHVAGCYSQHTLNYLLGAGQLEGELMETIWGPIKAIVQSMRSMTPYHRLEALNFLFSDHNWLKLVSLGNVIRHILPYLGPLTPYFSDKVISAKLKAAVTALSEANVAFVELCRSLPIDINQQAWEEQEREAVRNRGASMKIFDIKMDKGVCIQNISDSS